MYFVFTEAVMFVFYLLGIYFTFMKMLNNVMYMLTFIQIIISSIRIPWKEIAKVKLCTVTNN